jgi:hypothetical protein
MDRIRFIPDRVLLTEEAANRDGTVDGFRRHVSSVGKVCPKSLTLHLEHEKQHLLTVVAQRLDDGRWRASAIDVNLPAILHGHNGWPLHTQAELDQSLTIARHFLRRVTTKNSHTRLVPGLGAGNEGYIKSLEAMVQIQDPGHRLLKCSHVCSLPFQHKATFVCWGESTRFRKRNFNLSLYDKAAQRRGGGLSPAGVPGIRIEAVYKTPEQLAADLALTGCCSAVPGKAAKTVSLDSSYQLVRLSLSKLVGWPKGYASDLGEASRPVMALILGLGDGIADPYEVEAALERYKHTLKPNEKTFRAAAKTVREYAGKVVSGRPAVEFPSNHQNLPRSDLRDHMTEIRYQGFLKEQGAPSTLDPDIHEAWSTTTFLPELPHKQDLIGITSPGGHMPWSTTL